MKPRLRVVDTSGPEYSGTQVKRKRRPIQPQKTKQREPVSDVPPHIQQWPLETLLIQRAVLQYGRRSAALGAQQGALALRTLASKIRELGPPSPALEQIMRDAEGEALRLRALLTQAYEEDDRSFP